MSNTSMAAAPITTPRIKARKRRQAVTFGTVQVREFERIAGDNPAVAHGPPLALGWGFVENDALSVAAYEKQRQRCSVLMPLNADTRKFLLVFVFDISAEELALSEKAVKRVQRQRRETCAKMNIRRKNRSQVPPPEKEDTLIKKVQSSKEVIVEDPLPRKRRERSDTMTRKQTTTSLNLILRYSTTWSRRYYMS